MLLHIPHSVDEFTEKRDKIMVSVGMLQHDHFSKFEKQRVEDRFLKKTCTTSLIYWTCLMEKHLSEFHWFNGLLWIPSHRLILHKFGPTFGRQNTTKYLSKVLDKRTYHPRKEQLISIWTNSDEAVNAAENQISRKTSVIGNCLQHLGTLWMLMCQIEK